MNLKVLALNIKKKHQRIRSEFAGNQGKTVGAKE